MIKTKSLKSIMKPFNKIVANLETFIADQNAQALKKSNEASRLKTEAVNHKMQVQDAQDSLKAVKALMPKDAQ